MADAQRQFSAVAQRTPNEERKKLQRKVAKPEPESTESESSETPEGGSPVVKSSTGSSKLKKESPSTYMGGVKGDFDTFYRKMKALARAAREQAAREDALHGVPPRPWDPTAPLEELKKLLVEQNWEGVRAWVEEGDDMDSEGTDEGTELLEGEKGEWSLGSEKHKMGQCRPCHYVFSKTGCQNGKTCNFCHLLHPKRFRPRPCKSKRSKCKQLAAVLDQVLADDPERFQSVAEQLSAQGGYLHTVVKSKLHSMAKKLKHEAGSGEPAHKSAEPRPGSPGPAPGTLGATAGGPATEAKRVLKPGLVSL